MHCLSWKCLKLKTIGGRKRGVEEGKRKRGRWRWWNSENRWIRRGREREGEEERGEEWEEEKQEERKRKGGKDISSTNFDLFCVKP